MRRITPTRRTANAAIERYHPIRGPHVSQAAAPLTGVHDPENELQGPEYALMTPVGTGKSFENAPGNAPAKSIGAAMARTSARTAKVITGKAQLVLPRETTPITPPAIPNANPAERRPKLVAAIMPVLFSPARRIRRLSLTWAGGVVAAAGGVPDRPIRPRRAQVVSGVLRPVITDRIPCPPDVVGVPRRKEGGQQEHRSDQDEDCRDQSSSRCFQHDRMSDTGTAITLKKVRGREGATSFRRGSERGAELPSRAPRGPSSSRALIAVPSLDESRE